MNTLFNSVDIALGLSGAEGWNLPLLECIACGRPCLTTDNTAQADYIKRGIYPEELIITSHQKEPTQSGKAWWLLDEDEMASKINQMIKNPVKYLKMEQRCLDSMSSFTWANAGKRLGEVLQTVIK